MSRFHPVTTHAHARLRLGLRLLAAAWMLAAGPAAARPDSSAVVARADGTEITADRFRASYVRHLIRTGRNDTPAERYAHLHELVDVYLLAGEARARGLEDEAYHDYADLQLRKAVGDRYYGLAFLDSLPDLTEAELREAFLRSKDRIVARHLLFSTEAEARAAHARLEAGEDFLALAAEVFGTAPADSAAGYLGPAGYWDLADPLAEAAYALPEGTYSGPVRTRYGWHIIRVERRLDDPLPTESEYRYRREGIRRQARQRRMRLAGDRFVASFMEDFDVTVHEPGVAALAGAIRRAVGGEEPAVPRTGLATEEVAALRRDLTPETVLATFRFEGKRRVFTARDFAGWLEELPYDEVRRRPAAAVGRALRNEALALAGFARKLERDPAVLGEVHHRTSVYLAGRLRDALRASASAAPTEEELRTGYRQLGFDRLKSATADYWLVPFPTPDAAEAARRAVASGAATAASFPGFERRDGANLLGADELGHHVRRAPLRTPVVIGTGKGGWYLVEVAARALSHATFEEARPGVEAALRQHLPELRLRRALRAAAAVEIDHARFRQMMRADGLP